MRFFAVVGFTYLNTHYLIIFFVLVFLFSALMNDAQKRKTFRLVSMIGIGAAFVYLINYNANIKSIRNISDMDLTITGKIVELPAKRDTGGYRYTMWVERSSSIEIPHPFKVMLCTSNPIEAEVYDGITCDIHTFVPENTPEFPAESFYRAKGIYLQAFLYEHRPIKVDSPVSIIMPFYYYVLRVRQRLILIIDSCFPKEQASVINGMFLGNRNFLSKDMRVSLERSGVYHLFAVSGVHISILSGIFVTIFKTMRLNSKKIYVLTAIVIFLFMALTGFTPSVMRSGIISVVYFLGEIFFRKADSINSTGLAVLFITLFNPDASMDIALWLSVTATLGIIILTPKLYNLLREKGVFAKHNNKFLNSIINSVLVTVSANMATFPILVFCFKKISTVTIISNVLLIFPVTIILFLVVLLILLCVLRLPAFIVLPVKLSCGILINYVIFIVKTLSSLSIALISLDYPYIKVWCLIVLTLTCALYLFKKLYCMYRALVLFSLMLFAILYFLHRIKMTDLTRISVLNSGEGCSLVCSKNNANVAIFNIGKKTNTQAILDYLSSTNIFKIENLILTGYSDENLQFINNFISVYGVKNVVNTSDNKQIAYYDDRIKIFNEQFSSKLFEDSDFSIKKINGMQYYFINILDVKIIVCPNGGDAENISESLRTCDVFVTGGFPSNYDKTNCLYAILSMSKKDLEMVANKIKNEDKNFLYTALQGTVYIDVNRSGKLSVGRRI